MRNLALFTVFTSTLILAGCSSSAQRQAECEAQGISQDTCYLTEQNRKTAVNEAAQKQAMENAQALYPVQKAQSAHRTSEGSHSAASGNKSKLWEGMKLIVSANGLTVDGKPAAEVEKTAKATVYQQGLFNYIVYSNGKIGVTDTSNTFKGYAK